MNLKKKNDNRTTSTQASYTCLKILKNVKYFHNIICSFRVEVLGRSFYIIGRLMRETLFYPTGIRSLDPEAYTLKRIVNALPVNLLPSFLQSISWPLLGQCWAWATQVYRVVSVPGPVLQRVAEKVRVENMRTQVRRDAELRGNVEIPPSLPSTPNEKYIAVYPSVLILMWLASANKTHNTLSFPFLSFFQTSRKQITLHDIIFASMKRNINTLQCTLH